MPEFEIAIRGGTVVDGTGTPKFTADVGIRGGRIAEIGRIAPVRAERVLDADGLVYDLTKIKRLPDWTKTEVVHDQPAGEWRRIQRAGGYHWTLVNGEITFEGDACTGATPGRLIRHGR